MSVLSDLTIQIGLDDSGVDEGAKSVKEKVGKLGKSLGNLGRGLTAGVTMPIVAGFGFAIAAASDLSEATSAVETTYGDAAAGIIKASESSAEAVGLSQAEYLAASTTLGVFGKMAGKTGDDLTAFGNDSIGAAADLASFYNVPVPEALAAIQSGLMGEYEPLRKFGIMLSDATLQQFALEQGLWDGVGAMTESQKVAARQAYITANMGDATGDFARTSDGLANQMRILKARFKDIAAQFGKILIPYMIKGTKYLSKFADFVEGLSSKQKKWAIAFLAVAAAIGPVLIGLSLMLPALLVLTGPIGLIVLALAALGTAYALNLFGFRDAVNWAAAALWDLITPVIDFGKALIEVFRSGDPVKKQLEAFPGILRPVIEPFLLIADAIGDLVAAYKSGGLENLLKVLPDKLKQIAKAFFDLHKAVLDLFLKGLKAAWPFVLAFIKKIPGWIKDAMSAAAAWLIPAGVRVIAGLAQGFRDRWPALKEWLNQRPGVIKDVFINAISLLVQKGKDIMQGMKDGLNAKWGGEFGVSSWFSGMPDRILRAIGSLLSTLVSKGGDLIQGLRNGITNAWDGGAGEGGGVRAWLAGIPSKALNAVGNLGGVLYNAGFQLLWGFYEGLLAVWNSYVKPLLDKIPWGLIPGLGMGMGAAGMSSGYASSSFTPTGGGNATTNVGGITIQIMGYDKDKTELANEVAGVIARQKRMMFGVPA